MLSSGWYRMRGITVTRIQNSLEALKVEVERHEVRPILEHIHHPSLPGVSHFISFQLGVAFMECINFFYPVALSLGRSLYCLHVVELSLFYSPPMNTERDFH